MLNLMIKAFSDAEKLTENGMKYVIITKTDIDEVIMDIGLVRLDGIREVPHATRKYYVQDGEVRYLTYPHC